MSQFDRLLKMYAENGLRSVEDWTTRGREIEAGAVARLNTPYRGTSLPLYSRDQTVIHVRARAK
jgi:hypothetical protein